MTPAPYRDQDGFEQVAADMAAAYQASPQEALEVICSSLVAEIQPLQALVDAGRFYANLLVERDRLREALEEALSWIAMKAPTDADFEDDDVTHAATGWTRDEARQARALLRAAPSSQEKS